ncbi:SDR family oxidoreductase [Paraburkholderia sp.]|uniref:SDR family oxidoreductase n=1 Tax=Paraburkholderia sp. TaxID=1926495 RepID=UPI003D6DFB5F
MQIKGRTALVTGANRGLGLHFAKALLEAGAAKVYAAARNPASVDIPGVVPIQLDVTDPASIAAAAARASDVDLLINNAGAADRGLLLDPQAVDRLRGLIETNGISLLTVTQAFAPVLKRNGGGAVVNVLSVLSWFTAPGLATYSGSKALGWQLTNGLRQELHGQQTRVIAVHPAYIDTDMTKGVTGPKSRPEDVVRIVLEGVEQNLEEILVDEIGRQVKQSLSSATPAYLATSV